MRSFKHLTARYTVNRAALMWWQRRHPDSPWLTPAAVGILDGWLRPGDTVFEWGSGRSTAWFARRVSQVSSVEHDPQWFSEVEEQLQRSQGASVARYLHPAHEGVNDESSHDYVTAIGVLADETVDLVLVDGLHRDQCALNAVQKLRPGGLLVLDNADWYLATGSEGLPSQRVERPRSETWKAFEEVVRDWRRIVTTNGVWDTVIWTKPANTH